MNNDHNINSEYDASIFILTKGGDVVDLNEYDQMTDDGQIIMLTNERLNPEYGDDDTIFIHKTLCLKKIKDWMIAGEFIDGISTIALQTSYTRESAEQRAAFFTSDGEYLHGWRQTMGIMRNVRRMIQFDSMTLDVIVPVVMYAYNSKVDFCGSTYHGYLPAIGQLVYLHKNMGEFRTAFELLNEEHDEWISLILNKCWSSTQYSEMSVWIMSFDHDMTIWYDKKNNESDKAIISFPYVLPFFKVEL